MYMFYLKVKIGSAYSLLSNNIENFIFVLTIFPGSANSRNSGKFHIWWFFSIFGSLNLDTVWNCRRRQLSSRSYVFLVLDYYLQVLVQYIRQSAALRLLRYLIIFKQPRTHHKEVAALWVLPIPYPPANHWECVLFTLCIYCIYITVSITSVQFLFMSTTLYCDLVVKLIPVWPWWTHLLIPAHVL